jgi:glutathione S-transferase
MSVCAAKVRNALDEKGVAWEGVLMNLRAGDAQKAEYTRLNPGQVVPTLVHDGAPIVESNVILEYVEDTWPQTPLRPAAPLARARMRLWMKQLDDGLHAATGTISTCIAFRHQHLARKPEELQAWLDAMVDSARRERSRLAVELGMESPGFAPAVQRFEKLLTDMNAALAAGPWLAGNDYSLADIAYSPYMLRLQHLGFGERIAARPRVADWVQRLFATDGYKSGVAQWLNPAYLALFERERPAATKRMAQILAA